MLPFEEARQRLLNSSPPPIDTETLPLGRAIGRVLARGLVSKVDLPPFDNSAMDGYAVRSADLAGATTENPVGLELAGRVPAGAAWERCLAPGSCLRIFTGSPLPDGADAVVMQEDARLEAGGNRIWFSEPAAPWENIRLRGEDIRAGTSLLQPGTRLRPPHAGLVAAVGLDRLEVFRKPSIWIAATGNELQEPGESARPGSIYESNRAGLAALAEEAGAQVRLLPILPDNLEATTQFFRDAAGEADFVLTSGGVSVGEHDHVKAAFAAAGGTMEFWRVLMKPGKPFAHGKLGRTIWFGLPGNPVSAMVTFLTLVRPVLMAAQGAANPFLESRAGVLGVAVANRGPRRNFLRATIHADGTILPAAGQASHMLSAFTTANALLEAPPETHWPAGAPANVMLLPGC